MQRVLVLAVWMVGRAFGLAQTVEMRPMTVDDWLNMVTVQGAAISPDGTSVLYETSQLDWKKNARKRLHHLIPAQGGASYQFLGEPEGRNPAYSPDGKWLAFTRKVEEKAQIFVMRTIGGEARQATRHKSPVVRFKWAADSSTLFFISDDPLSKELEQSRKDGQDAIWVDEGVPDGFRKGPRLPLLLDAMVSDWTSEYGPGFNYDVTRWYIGKTPWEDAERWRQKSALTHVGAVQTPTILFHGMKDITDTEPQSMMFYSALKDRGVPVRYLRFPREPHGFREPRHQRERDVEEIRWMQKYVMGIDWEPGERPVDDGETEGTAPAPAREN